MHSFQKLLLFWALSQLSYRCVEVNWSLHCNFSLLYEIVELSARRNIKIAAMKPNVASVFRIQALVLPAVTWVKPLPFSESIWQLSNRTNLVFYQEEHTKCEKALQPGKCNSDDNNQTQEKPWLGAFFLPKDCVKWFMDFFFHLPFKITPQNRHDCHHHLTRVIWGPEN